MSWYTGTRRKQITIAVLLVHVFLLAMLGADHWMHRNRVERKKVIVNTFIAAPPPPAAAPISAKPKTQATSPPKKAIPKQNPKKQTVKAVPQTPSIPDSRNATAQDALLAEIEKNLNSLTTTDSSAPKKSNIVIPALNFQPQTRERDNTERDSKIGKRQGGSSDFLAGARDIARGKDRSEDEKYEAKPTPAELIFESRAVYSAAEQIGNLLQEALELPEFGEVKIRLSINRLGILEKLDILEAKSQKNGDFLKKRLPELLFPCLNEPITLTIVFSNAL